MGKKMDTEVVSAEEMREFLFKHTNKFDRFSAPPDCVKIKRLRQGTPELPTYATKLSAGMDLRADLTGMPHQEDGQEVNYIRLMPHQRCTVPTGLSIALPAGYEGQIRSRSGLASKYGVCVLNSPGTLDADYRGEVGVILFNTSDKEYDLVQGDRIAQLVISKVERLSVQEVQEVDATERGAGGFGSTGVK